MWWPVFSYLTPGIQSLELSILAPRTSAGESEALQNNQDTVHGTI